MRRDKIRNENKAAFERSFNNRTDKYGEETVKWLYHTNWEHVNSKESDGQ